MTVTYLVVSHSDEYKETQSDYEETQNNQKNT